MCILTYPLGTSMTQAQSVLLLYGLSGGKIWPVAPMICLLHLPEGSITGEVVKVPGRGSVLIDSDDERKANKKVAYKSTVHNKCNYVYTSH